MDIKDALKQEFKNGSMKMFHIEGDIWLVPCVTNFAQNKFKALMKPLKIPLSDAHLINKQGWGSSEDELLSKIVASRGAKAWSSVAKEINALVHSGVQMRSGRHCRERWYNHVDPSLRKGGWTEEEDCLLISLHSEIGGKWSEIAKRISGRTENSVKNRFKALEKKGNLSGENRGFVNLISQENEAQVIPYEISPLLLLSPHIVNFDFSAGPEVDILNSPYMIRPIRGKMPSQEKVSEAKQRLQRDLFEMTTSPSDFLHFRNI